MLTFDPIASPTTRIAPHREPAFVFPEQVDATRAKLARLGRKPNILAESGYATQMSATKQPWFLYHGTRGAHFDNYPLERFLGSSPIRRSA